MACPFCHGSSSTVVRSRGLITINKIHRRRECAECGRRFPTGEAVDWGLLEQELEGTGDTVPATQATAVAPPATWLTALALFHHLWGGARTGAYAKSEWRALQSVLDGLSRASS
jgi:hypothetical protein